MAGSRDWNINGETLVRVKGAGALANLTTGLPQVWELGLALEAVRVRPRFVHHDVHCDDFGPEIPAEVMVLLADVTVRMDLVHYDHTVLDACLAESLGGSVDAQGRPAPGTLAGAGTLLGGNNAPGAAGCHFISLTLTSPVLAYPWRFPGAYLTGPAAEFPLGTEKTVVRVEWRCVPYTPYGTQDPTKELLSAGAILWDRNPDI